MPAKRKEVVVAAGGVYAEDAGPDALERALRLRLRRLERRLGCGVARDDGKRGRIQLPVRGERELG